MNTALKHPFFPEDPEPPESSRRKHRGWRIAGWTILGIICFLIAAILILGGLVNTDGEHTALINFVQNEASKALGTRVSVQNLVVHWAPLGVDLYGITVDGAEPRPAPPLLRIDHVGVGMRIISLFKGTWFLSSLRIDHPVVWMTVDSHGASNLPKIKSGNSNIAAGSSGAVNGNGRSNKSSTQEIFKLGIRHAILDRGEVYYNSSPRAIDANLHHLTLHAVFNVSRQTYSGKVAYSDGVLRYGTYRPIPHNLDATFRLTPAMFQLSQATLSSGDSRIRLVATVQNYASAPAAQAQYNISIDCGQFRRLLRNSNLPVGFLYASGSIDYTKQTNLPLLQSVSVDGNLTSSRLDVNAADARAQITNLIAHYSLHDGDAILRDFRASILGGELMAQGQTANLGGDSHSAYQVQLRNISLAQLKRKAGKAAAVPGVRLAGTLNATATASWGKTMADLAARANASIHASATAGQSPATQTTIPVNGEIHAAYKRRNAELTLANSYLRAPEINLSFDGTVGRRSNLAIGLEANDLRGLATIVNSFRPPQPGRAPFELSGRATFRGGISGSTTAPRVTGLLIASNLNVNGSVWKLVRANIDASPDHAALRNALIEPAQRGHIALNARVSLDKWAFRKRGPIAVKLHASNVAVADLVKFTGKQFPVKGTLRASIKLQGSAMEPAGNGKIVLTHVTAYRQPVRLIHVAFDGNGAQARVHFSVRAAAGNLNGQFSVQPRQRTYTMQITSPGIVLDRLAAIADHPIKANGVLRINASGQGSFSNPQLQATVESPSLTVSGKNIPGQTISALKLRLNVANHVAEAVLSSTALDAPIDARATVHLAGDYLANASLNTPVLSLQPILALYSRTQAADITGQAQVQAVVSGPLKHFKQMTARITFPVLNLAYRDTVKLAEVQPVKVSYQDGVINVAPGAIRGTGTNLSFAGRIPISRGQPASLQLHGAVDLGIAQLFNPQLRSSGQVKLNIDSHGSLSNGANLGGEIDIVNANFADPSLPVGLQNGNGVVKLSTDRVNIASFSGTVGGGVVTMQGGLQYRPHLVFGLGMSAKGVRMLYPQGMREEIDANIHLDGTTTHSLLAGTVNLANVSFTPAFDLTSFAGQLSGGVEAPPPMGFTQALKLNLDVHSGSTLNLVSRTLSINGAANLQVRGTAAQPVILGRINITGGDMIFNGNRFVLTGGTIQFVNPTQTEPVLNLGVTTTIQQYQINLRFEGPASSIRPEYSSNPSLPPADIIHLLAFGSTTEAAANNSTPANVQAESLVASQVSSQVTSRLSKVAGISQLSISPVLQSGTAQGPPGANITIRQRVTSKLFVTLSTNVATTQNQVIQGQYQVSPRVSVSATRDQNGGFGIDVLIKKSW